LYVIRPADANEVVEAWKVAVARKDGPTALLFSRQNLPTLDRSIYASASELHHGAYVLADIGDNMPELILMATGSEVNLIVRAGEFLAAEGVNVRMVSFPCWELFEKQDEAYRNSVLLPEVKARLAVESGIAQGWHQWVGDKGGVISLDHFGASAPAKILYEEFGFTVENVITRARELLNRPPYMF
jgi:transketolase